MNHENSKNIFEFGYNIGGPIIVSFSEWLMKQIETEQVNCVYFLSRDGYSIKKVVDSLSKDSNIVSKYKYLYISRITLRLPLFHFATDKELDDLLFYVSGNTTLEKILMRAAFQEEERLILYDSLHLQVHEEKKILNLNEVYEYKGRLLQNEFFLQRLNSKSIKAYKEICEYFQQEDVFTQNKLMFVDCGWSGSIQHCVSRIIKKFGYTGDIVGAYIGMMNSCQPEDGRYLTWLFQCKKEAGVYFNTSVFESLLSAPHGMTIGYKNEKNKWVPVLQDVHEEYINIINLYITGIMEYLSSDIPHKNKISYIREKITRLMRKPTVEEVETLTKFQFSAELFDDNTYQYFAEHQKSLIIRYNIFRRLVGVLFKKKKPMPEIYWYGGTLADEHSIKKIWCLANYFVGKKLWCIFGKEY